MRIFRVRRNTVIVIGVLTTMVLAACSTSGNGLSGSPTTASPTTGSSASGPTGAPHVGTPLATSKFQSNPCSSLTTAQLQQLGAGTDGHTASSGLGPTCNWGGSTGTAATPSTATVTYLTAGSGLSSVYTSRSSYDYFQPTTVDGYPAVYALLVDNRAHGECSVTVGVSDQLAVAIGLTVNSGQYRTDPCTPNTQLAADVISNIKNTSS
jgi:hypothetical protein